MWLGGRGSKPNQAPAFAELLSSGRGKNSHRFLAASLVHLCFSYSLLMVTVAFTEKVLLLHPSCHDE